MKEKKELTVDEINIKLQEAVARDAGSAVLVLPVLSEATELEHDVEDWDEYVARVLEEGPVEELKEEVI